MLPKRPDLKLIITSATIDAERFFAAFQRKGQAGAGDRGVGPLYPVEVRYRPVVDEDKRTTSATSTTPSSTPPTNCRIGQRRHPGLPARRAEIREAAKPAQARAGPAGLSAHAPEILPLFSRLSAGEQDRIFKPDPAASGASCWPTNVAETSLTVPGIRYVIDTGLARVKRYSYRNKVEQLQVEISQAAAPASAGRCGRVAAGVCVRLYDEAGFQRKPGAVHRSGNPAFLAGRRHPAHEVAAPDRRRAFPSSSRRPQGDQRRLRAAAGTGALDDERALTPVGRRAKLPLDPRIGRMLVAARDLGCLTEVLVIAAGLSTQDPRERPQEKRQQAADAHKNCLPTKSRNSSAGSNSGNGSKAVWTQEIEQSLVDTCPPISSRPAPARVARQVQLASAGADGHRWAGRKTSFPAQLRRHPHGAASGLLGNIGCKSDESATTSARAA